MKWFSRFSRSVDKPTDPVTQNLRVLRKVVVVWLCLLSLLLLSGGLVEDYRSCQRQEPVRKLSKERQQQLKKAWYQDADRAQKYAALDSNPRGRVVNTTYARDRRALAYSVKAAPQINCSTFPPGT